MGLEIEEVSGYGKGYGYTQGQKLKETNHSWNAIQIDGTWKLFDATWGQGSAEVQNGKLINRIEFDPFWFDTDIYAFMFSHLPESSEWQLIDDPLTLDEYNQLPYIKEDFFDLGFDAKETFEKVRDALVTDVPTIYSVDIAVRVVKAPINKYLQKGNNYEFSFYAPRALAFAIITTNEGDQEWIHLTKEGGYFKVIYSAIGGELRIGAKYEGGGESYHMILGYEVGADADVSWSEEVTQSNILASS